MTRARANLVPAAAIGAVFIASLVVMLRPWPSSISDGLPQNLGDPALLTWILHWGAHALTTDPVHYFNGTMFWPAGSTLAYSDLMLPFVPVYGLAWAATGSWPLATNLTVLAMFLLSLVATHLLARRLGASRAGAVIAAFAFTYSGFSLSEWGHLQLHTLGLLPLAALLTLQLLERPSWWRGVIAGAAAAAVLLASAYYGLVWALALPVLVGGHLVARRRTIAARPMAVGLGSFAVVAALLLAPALLKYSQEAEARPYETEGGLRARDLVTPPFASVVWGRWFTFAPEYPASKEHGLYPGVTVVALAGVGAATAFGRSGRRERREERERHDRLHLTLLCAAGALTFVVALGPTAFGLPMPFRLLHDHVPGYEGIRAYTRFWVLTSLATALLAGRGLTELARVLGRPGRAVLVAVVPVLVLVDLAADLPYWPLLAGPGDVAVNRRLASLPEAPVVELPLVDPTSMPAEWAYTEAPRLVRSTLDFRPRVNGYSARVREGYVDDLRTFNGFPAEPRLRRARELGVRYVVLHVAERTDHAAFSEDDARARVAARPPGATAERVGAAWLVDLEPRGTYHARSLSPHAKG